MCGKVDTCRFSHSSCTERVTGKLSIQDVLLAPPRYLCVWPIAVVLWQLFEYYHYCIHYVLLLMPMYRHVTNGHYHVVLGQRLYIKVGSPSCPLDNWPINKL